MPYAMPREDATVAVRWATILVESQRRTLLMAQAKRTSKSKRRNKAVPVLGIAGVSLAVAGGGASASTAPVSNVYSQNTAARQLITLGEEEISDVSLSTFYVFDKELAAAPQGEKVAWGRCGGCRCGGCRCAGRCGGCGWNGCWGCGCGACCVSWGRCRWAC